MKEKKPSIFLLMLVTFFVMIIFVIVPSDFISSYKNYKLGYKNVAETEGIVTDVKEKRVYDDENNNYTIEYSHAVEYTINGYTQTYHYTTKTQLSKGTKIPLFYSKNDPSRISTSRVFYVDDFWVAAIFMLVGIGLLIFDIVLFYKFVKYY